jgi:hypothetical protein
MYLNKIDMKMLLTIFTKGSISQRSILASSLVMAVKTIIEIRG